MVYQRFQQLLADEIDTARIWPVGQVVKTEASHAFNIGSNPVRVTIFLLTESGKVNIMVVTAKAAAI